MTGVIETKVEMVWLDMETTGLDALQDVPLEVGIILTDRWGNIVKDGKVKYLVWEDAPAFSEAVHRGRSTEVVNDMHVKSGLWDDLENETHMTRRTVDQMLISFLKNHGVEKGTMPMCGSSVGSLDRPFVIRHFPRLNKFLHYRNIDISTVKELCKLLNPEIYEQIKPFIGTKEDALHRVMDDCLASIHEYNVYQDEFLFIT
jgi:oligoribonuclease